MFKISKIITSGVLALSIISTSSLTTFAATTTNAKVVNDDVKNVIVTRILPQTQKVNATGVSLSIAEERQALDLAKKSNKGDLSKAFVEQLNTMLSNKKASSSKPSTIEPSAKLANGGHIYFYNWGSRPGTNFTIAMDQGGLNFITDLKKEGLALYAIGGAIAAETGVALASIGTTGVILGGLVVAQIGALQLEIDWFGWGVVSF